MASFSVSRYETLNSKITDSAFRALDCTFIKVFRHSCVEKKTGLLQQKNWAQNSYFLSSNIAPSPKPVAAIHGIIDPTVSIPLPTRFEPLSIADFTMSCPPIEI